MNNFETLDELNQYITTNDCFTADLSTITINEVTYTHTKNLLHSVNIHSNLIFNVFEADSTSAPPMLALISKFKYFGAVDHKFYRITADQLLESEGGRPIIGNIIQISFPELGDKSYEAKVDTGAEMCCLHADNIKFDKDGGTVAFEFDGNRITMNLAGVVEIQTADNGGTERPIVKLAVKCEQGVLKNVQFNLNDRSDMPEQILLGKDFLQAGNFLIDPLQERTDEQLTNILIEAGNIQC